VPLARTSANWQQHEFHDFLEARAMAPFVWGSNDCALFAADAIKSFTGVDLAADVRDKYTDEASALTVLKSFANGTSIADAIAACAVKAGLEELAHPLMAQRGDLIVMKQQVEGLASLIAGVVHLNGREGVTVGEGGLVTLPLSSVVRAWRV
jgi:hypothetical protein